MANDRIYLVCKNCSEKKMFAKYYPSMGHGIWFPDQVSEWVEEHMECSPYFGQMDLNGDRCFNLITESIADKDQDEDINL